MQGIRKPTWGESLLTSGYNIKFRALAYLEEHTSGKTLHNFQTIYLLGEHFTANPENNRLVNQLIEKKVGSTVWSTYRTQFPPLKDSKGFDHVADVGWGCMVRVGQMYIAQCLKKLLRLEEQSEMNQILKLLDDFSQTAMFSIQNIVRKLQQQYDLEPGSWYNPSQVVFAILEVFNSFPANPYKQSLTILVMNNATLFLDQVVCKMTGQKELCKCKRDTIVCYNCSKKTKSVSLVLLVRIGLNAPEAKYLRCLNKIMESPMFQGILGGKPKKALFILGKISDRYLYLDPHVVHTAVNEGNFETEKQNYFCRKVRSCKNTSIDPSIGMSFYLENLKDIDDLYVFLLKIKTDSPEQFFLYMDTQTPQFMKQDQTRDVNVNAIDIDQK